ncbi:MAG: hypothetical protein H6R26_3615, partial [Proteobacteria bacterium]|nr:hypothetical protein [Pseudomonadota bacterium]
APTKHVRTQPIARFPAMAPRMPVLPRYTLPRYIEPGQRTVDDVLVDYGPYVRQQLEPYFESAGLTYPPREITLLALKQEKKLELWARNDGPFRLVRHYDIRAASGTSGPKLRQGDRQVPEGIYRIVGLNPNSNYHLSLKLNYPNEFDLYHAELEGRSSPGSDIFIHGKAVSIGCLAIGDEAIEQLFVLAARTGRENIKVVIAPRDPRVLPLNADDADLPEWAPELYAMIERAVFTLEDPVRLSLKGSNLPTRTTLRR